MNEKITQMKTQIGDVIKAWGEWVSSEGNPKNEANQNKRLHYEYLYNTLDEQEIEMYYTLKKFIYNLESYIIAMVGVGRDGDY